MHATYSPDDNKLRLYTDSRLDADDYARAKACGFRWAPKQQLFVAPRWTPQAEDLLHEWCGDIGDEDTSLVERAEERSERFEGYSVTRERDGDAAERGVRAIANNIPLGQPILVGHHSEKRARRDAQRIEDGMRKAVRMWETAEYWTQRAAGARAHARYKELPAVRARRIKKLEAERRRFVRSFTPDEKAGTLTQQPFGVWRCKEENHPAEDYCDSCRPCEHVWTGAGRAGCWTPTRDLPAIEKGARRWIEHIDRRLSYERAMLEDQGASDLLKPKARKRSPSLRNYRPSGGVYGLRNKYRDDELRLPLLEMTKAEWKRIPGDYKGSNVAWDRSHRVRVVMRSHKLHGVFLTDSKDHGEPAA